MTIDIDKLREDFKEESYGAFFVGGFGGTLMEASDIEKASPEKIVEIAQEQGVDLRKYICSDLD